MDRLAIIDGDPIVYSVAYALQQYALSDLTCNGHIIDIFDMQKEAKEHASDLGLEKEDYEVLPYADVTEDDVVEYLTYSIGDIMDVTEATEAEIWLSSSTNFRKEIDVEYKAHRGEKPLLYNQVRKVLDEQFGARTAEKDYEADDEIADKAWNMRSQDQSEDYIICSIDKDLDTVPGWHYNWPIFNREGRMYFVDPEEAMHIFWISVLTGDAADNIPGLKGIGPKKAEKLLVGCRTDMDYYEVCKNAYMNHYKDSDPSEVLVRLEQNILLLTIGKGTTYGQSYSGTD